MTKRRTWLPVTLLAVALAGGCADDVVSAPSSSPADSADNGGSKVEQGLTVQTRFEIVGWDDAASVLDVERLYLNVGAIFLEPVEDGAAASFANREPFALEFRPEDGVVSELGPEMILPHGGTFAVSVQLEPASAVDPDKDADDEAASVVVDGRWSPGTPSNTSDERRFEPSPLPCIPKEADTRVPFTYSSDAVARFQVEEITLEGDGVYELVVTLRVGGWLDETVVPALENEISRQRRRGDLEQYAVNFFELIDAAADGDAVGIEGLFGGMGVTTRRY